MRRAVILEILLALVELATFMDGTNYIYVDVNHGVDNETCWSVGKDGACKSLLYALTGAHFANSTTVLMKEGNYTLAASPATDFYRTNELRLVGEGHEVHITCPDGVGGLSFVSSTLISIINVTFSGCAALRNSTSANLSSTAFSFLKVNVTLHFLFCTNITMVDVSVMRSAGIGVTVYATSGSNLFFNCSFIDNKATSGGGGLYIEFPYCIPGDLTCDKVPYSMVPQKFVSRATYNVSGCRFCENVAYPADLNFDTYILPQKHNHVAFGRGGGLSVFFKGNATNNSVAVHGCTFANNTAMWGGGMFMEHQDFSTSNLFTVELCTFTNNSCSAQAIKYANGTGGGGVRLGYIFFEETHCSNNKILFRGCIFSKNVAYFGGGVSFYAPKEDSQSPTNELQFENCSWKSNIARLGSAIDLALWHPVVKGETLSPVFKDCQFENNSYVQIVNQYVGIGAVYCDTMPITFTGINKFLGNSYSALAVVSSYILFDNNSSASFVNNTGRVGGAVALLGNAFIIVSYNSALSFVGNQAEVKGGAIYAEIVGQHDLLSSRNCFIRHKNVSCIPSEWQSRFYFFNNTIKRTSSINAIFATTILTCVWGGAYGNATVDDLSAAFKWTSDWQYNDTNLLNEISTDPLYYTPSNVSSALIIPGQPFPLQINAFDDIGNNVTSTLVLAVTSENESSIYVSDTTRYVTNDTIIVYGDCGKSATISLVTMDPKVIYTQVNTIINDCPPGMILNTSQNWGYCDCGKGFKGNVKCSGVNHRYLQQGYWMGNVRNQSVVGETPYYYDSSNKTEAIKLPVSQDDLDKILCAPKNRTGTLCGACISGYGPAPNLKCSDCSPLMFSPIERVFIYAATQFAPLTIFFILLMAMNVNLTSGSMTPFVFFAQMITTTCEITAGGSITVPSYEAVSEIYQMWNLNILTYVLPSVCLSPNLLPHHMLVLQYITALYPLILIIIFYCLLDLYERGWRPVTFLFRPMHNLFARFKHVWKLKGSAINAIAAFILLSYFKFTSISFALLTPAALYNDSGSIVEWVFYNNGNVIFFDSTVLPYCILALLIAALFVLGPPLVLIAPSVSRVVCVNRCLDCHSPKLQQFLDIFHGCFKDGTVGVGGRDLRWFAGVYFVMRLVMLVGNIAWNRFEHLIHQQLASIALILAVVFFRPYRHDVNNTIDVIFSANLVVINMITAYNYYYASVFLTQPHVLLCYVQYILILWPVLYVAWLATGACRRKISCKQSRPYQRVMYSSDDFIQHSRMSDVFVRSGNYQ